MSDYGDNKSIMKLSVIKNYKSKIAHRKKPVCLGGPCRKQILDCSLFSLVNDKDYIQVRTQFELGLY